MRDEHDFAEAEKGRFHHQGAVLGPPVHLDPDVLDFLSARAKSYGLSLSQLVNAMLRLDVELLQTVD